MLTVLLLGLALVLSGCGGESPAKPAAKDESSKTTDETEDAEPSGSDEPAPDPGFQVPKPGTCFAMSAAQSRASVSVARKVSCKRPHTSTVAHVGYLPAPVTAKTPLSRRRALGQKICAPAYRRVVGGTLADRASSILTWTLFTPSQAQLERGARWVRCDVLARSAGELIPLPASRPLLQQSVPEPLRVCQSAAGADVSCARKHALRVDAVFRAAPGGYPDPAQFTPTARDRCKELLGEYGGYWQPPSQAGWRSGDRFIRCLSATG